MLNKKLSDILKMKETHQLFNRGKKCYFLKPISLSAIPPLNPVSQCHLHAVHALCMCMPGALKALTITSRAQGFTGYSSKMQAGKQGIPKQPDYVSISLVYYPAKRT